MKIKLLIVAFSCCLILVQCKNPVIETTAKTVIHIKVDSTQEVIDLKLTDLADSFRLVRLETTDGAIINANDYYVSEKYIIAISQDGLYKFSSNGKFLNKIIGWGRGPDEVSGMYFAYFYDDTNDLLYIDDLNIREKLLVYDINLEKFLTPIKKAIQGPWGSFAILNDSLIIGKSPSYDAEPFAVFIQSFDGRFISGIPNNKYRLLGQNPTKTFQQSYLGIGQDDYRISFELDDTLFTFKDSQLIPYISLDFKKQREIPPNAKVQKGDRQITFPKIEAPSFLIMRVALIDEINWVTQTSGDSKTSYIYFFLNKSTGKYSTIKTYVDEFSGVIQSPKDGTIKLPMLLKNGKLFVIYQPDMIKKIAETGLNNTFFTPILKEDMSIINKDLHETDNPILLIGKLKGKI
jgi:hypothetical protein